jgi:replicative DNA helicase
VSNGSGLVAPHSLEAERSVLGQMLAKGTKLVGEVIGTQLSPPDFYSPPNQIVYEAVYEAYYADTPIDPLSIGEVCSKRLSALWSCSENDAIVRVRDMALGQQFAGNPVDHAKVVKRHSNYRHLLGLAGFIQQQVAEEKKGPEEIAGLASHNAMRIATDSLLTSELLSFGDLGRRYLKQAKILMEARAAGVELGVYFGLAFMDRYLRGLQPTELLIGAGEPGVGKSSVFWTCAMRFAERQMQKPEDKRIGTLILSLEMGEGPSNMRLAQSLAKIDGGKLREGNISSGEFGRIRQEWGGRKDLPLYFNFASHLRAAQMRALVVEAIRRHNVGLVVIDHMRYFDMDRRFDNQVQEDEEKARFLKESIAKDLNCAVICIAHTTKGIENTVDRRPTLSHLRGSGQVAAHADFVSFVYRPYMYADEADKLSGSVTEENAEMIWRKNRHGMDGIEPFRFIPETMTITN